MSIADDLNYKIGGTVPVWTAAVGLSGAYLIFEKTRKKNAPVATTGPVSPLTSPTEMMDPYAGIDPTTGLSYQTEYSQEQAWQNSPVGQYLSSDPTNAAYPVGITPAAPGTPSGLSAPISNPQWAEIAQNYLISKGNTPTDVMTAIQGFVNGSPLTPQDQAFVNLATSQLGSPPQPVTPNLTQSGTPVVAPTPVPAPVAPTNTNPYPGWSYIPTYAQFQAYNAQKRTIGWAVNGSAITTWFAGGKQVGAAPPSGARWYVAV